MFRVEAKAFSDALKETRKRLRDQRPVWRRVAKFAKADAQKIIVSSGLVKTGRLKRSIRARGDRRSVTVYTDIPYAVFHQYGTRRVPARNFISANERVMDEIGDALGEFLFDNLERAAR